MTTTDATTPKTTTPTAKCIRCGRKGADVRDDLNCHFCHRLWNAEGFTPALSLGLAALVTVLGGKLPPAKRATPNEDEAPAKEPATKKGTIYVVDHTIVGTVDPDELRKMIADNAFEPKGERRTQPEFTRLMNALAMYRGIVFSQPEPCYSAEDCTHVQALLSAPYKTRQIVAMLKAASSDPFWIEQGGIMFRQVKERAAQLLTKAQASASGTLAADTTATDKTRRAAMMREIVAMLAALKHAAPVRAEELNDIDTDRMSIERLAEHHRDVKAEIDKRKIVVDVMKKAGG